MTCERADLVVAVARADPVGLHDFIRGYQQLCELGVDADRIRVVVNQVRGGLFGGDAAGQVRAALSRYTGIDPVAFVPYDRAGMDTALMAGHALREARPGSPAQQALAGLAASLFNKRRTGTLRRSRGRWLAARAGRLRPPRTAGSPQAPPPSRTGG
jgi:Flp pilus assembly CpaE family ATPase